jgi:glycosyltransferase involved in cell wall biosynthesis
MKKPTGGRGQADRPAVVEDWAKGSCEEMSDVLGGSSTWPSISVIVPTRDRPELLWHAVQSILSQDYPGEVECVVVFDQSAPTPITVEPAERRRLHLIRNERTPGLAGARNAGVLASDGELVAFCDDDDDWLPGKLRLQVDAMRPNPEAVVATCGIFVLYRTRTIRRLPPNGTTVTQEQLLRKRMMEVHPSTVLVRRTALLGSIGLVDEAIPGSYAEDYEWLLRAARVAPIVVVREPLVRIHWHPSSFFEERWQMIARALTYLLDKHPEFEQEPAGLARIEGQLAFAYAALGQSKIARRWAIQALRRNWRERRGYVALAVSTRVLRPETVIRMAHTLGRGI